MLTMGLSGMTGGAVAAGQGAGICQEIARQSERALRLRLGGLHFEFRVRREPAGTAVGFTPEWSDAELERIARFSRRNYDATWEPGLRMTYGAAPMLRR